MGEHTTWLHLLPGYGNLEAFFRPQLQRSWEAPTVGLSVNHFTMVHVVIAALVAAGLTVLALSYRRRVASDNPDRLVPDPRFGVRNFFELVVEMSLGLCEGVMGKKNAERYFPVLGTLFFFILFSNLMGLVPGFVPATDTLKTNLALSLLVYGVRVHGPAYFKHFFGPIWWLAPMMLPIELIGHLVRPVSLALRLMGNMFADHKVIGTFFVLVPLLVPLPFYVLGILVSVVQAMVFTLLSAVYFQLAVEEHEEH